jgi:hypothetical protein
MTQELRRLAFSKFLVMEELLDLTLVGVAESADEFAFQLGILVSRWRVGDNILHLFRELTV